jgi:hypothetical protein
VSSDDSLITHLLGGTLCCCTVVCPHEFLLPCTMLCLDCPDGAKLYCGVEFPRRLQSSCQLLVASAAVHRWP